eukprot:GHVH01002088.1.p1 GENE.GHVH01002088.1~~GHVH01002088.1.p1  ORF type:complete len:640 (+),score=53.33 GHVH01002088.1:805-2724(+)
MPFRLSATLAIGEERQSGTREEEVIRCIEVTDTIMLMQEIREKIMKEDYNLIYDPNSYYRFSADLCDEGIMNRNFVLPRISLTGFLACAPLLQSFHEKLSQAFTDVLAGRSLLLDAYYNSKIVMTANSLQFLSINNVALTSYCEVHSQSPFAPNSIDPQSYDSALRNRDAKSIYKSLLSLSNKILISSSGHAVQEVRRGPNNKSIHATVNDLESLTNRNSIGQGQDQGRGQRHRNSIMTVQSSIKKSDCVCTIKLAASSDVEQLCSWINIYNLCYLHGLYKYGVPSNAASHEIFMGQIFHHLGEATMSLNNIKSVVFNVYENYSDLISKALPQSPSTLLSYASSSHMMQCSFDEMKNTSMDIAPALTLEQFTSPRRGSIPEAPRDLPPNISRTYSGAIMNSGRTALRSLRRLGGGPSKNSGAAMNIPKYGRMPSDCNGGTIKSYTSRTSVSKHYNAEALLWCSFFDVTQAQISYEGSFQLPPLLQPATFDESMVCLSNSRLSEIRIEIKREAMQNLEVEDESVIIVDNIVPCKNSDNVTQGRPPPKRNLTYDARIILPNSMKQLAAFSHRKDKDVLAKLVKHCGGSQRKLLETMILKSGRGRMSLCIDYVPFSCPNVLADTFGTYGEGAKNCKRDEPLE